MSDIGIKVSKGGESIETTDVRQILMSSSYPMFNYDATEVYGTVNISAGGTAGTASVAHNLDYVPAFVVYDNFGSAEFRQVPETWIFPFSGGSINVFDRYAYANTANINIVDRHFFPIGQDFWAVQGTENYGNNYIYWEAGAFAAGKKDGYVTDGALRFTDVDDIKGKTINSAWVQYRVAEKGTVSSNLQIITYGMDEDNTSDLIGDPLGRTRTTASTTQSVVIPPVSENFSTDVTDIVKEIVGRSGWSDGNAVGFMVFYNGSPDEVWFSPDQMFLYVQYNETYSNDYRIVVFKNKII